MGDAVNRNSQQAQQAQQSQQSHSIQGSIDRASPQSTFSSPTDGALHTLQQKNTRNKNHQRNQDHSPPKSSDNEVSVMFSFSASPSAFAPSSPIPLSTDTPEWRDPNTNSANQLQWAMLSTGNHITTIALDTR
jgi:hypothetical protein